LSSKKRWEVYVVTSFACNGKDTFSSNHLFIDDVAPKQFEPDSVSVDFATQRVTAGWTKPNDPDLVAFSNTTAVEIHCSLIHFQQITFSTGPNSMLKSPTTSLPLQLLTVV
jgi:hypothetical protein